MNESHEAIAQINCTYESHETGMNGMMSQKRLENQSPWEFVEI